MDLRKRSEDQRRLFDAVWIFESEAKTSLLVRREDQSHSKRCGSSKAKRRPIFDTKTNLVRIDLDLQSEAKTKINIVYSKRLGSSKQSEDQDQLDLRKRSEDRDRHRLFETNSERCRC